MKKNLILIGQFGMGKSSTGNKLLNMNKFTVGQQMQTVTLTLQTGESDNYKIVDCPGFGDTSDKFKFFNEYLEFFDNGRLITDQDYFDAIVMVVKFNKKEAASFLPVAKDFFEIFDEEGIKSLFVLCIQSNKELIMGDEEFKKCLYEQDGYKFLSEKNNNKHIPYVLWDNIYPYPNQLNELEKCINKISQVDARGIRFSLKNAEKKIKLMQLEDDLNTERNKPVEKEGVCNIS